MERPYKVAFRVFWLILALVFFVSWNIDRKSYNSKIRVQDYDTKYISDDEAYEVAHKYNSNKNYFYKVHKVYYKKKYWVPFFFRNEIIENSKVLYSTNK